MINSNNGDYIDMYADLKNCDDLLQLNILTFFTRAIIWGHHKMGTKLSQQNF